jgi:hypothetical protein
MVASIASFELKRTLATINQSLITDLNMFLHLCDHNQLSAKFTRLSFIMASIFMSKDGFDGVSVFAAKLFIFTCIMLLKNKGFELRIL